MAVVINEFEVAPAAAPAQAQAQPAGKPANGNAPPSAQLLRGIEKAVQAKQYREHRLTAY